MRVIIALIAVMSAISLIGIGAANAQQQARLQQFMQDLPPLQREQLKRLTPQQQRGLELRLQRLTPQRQKELQLRMHVWERYRGWSVTAKAFNVYDHCMRTTGKWTYRC